MRGDLSPLFARGEARAASAAKSGQSYLVDDLVGAHVKQRLFECRVAADGDVFINAFNAYPAAVFKRYFDLMLIERDLVLSFVDLVVLLEKQALDYAAGKELEVSAFAHQISFNLIPKIGGIGENGYSSEEMKLLNEGRKIMHLPDMKVTCTCVRVPVLRSHSISATVVTEDFVSCEDAAKAIAAFDGDVLYDDANNEKYPMPLVTSDQDKVFVGRIRRDLVNENGIALWCCGDQIRKGAATNAVQIAELL